MTDRGTKKAPQAPQISSEGFGARTETIQLDARRPYALHESAEILQLIDGHADLFAVPIADGSRSGVRRHLCRITNGGLLLGLSNAAANAPAPAYAILAVGCQGATARRRDPTSIDDLAALDIWIASFATAMAEASDKWNVPTMEIGVRVTLEAGQQLRAPSQGVAWLVVESGEFVIMRGPSVCRATDLAMPFASGMWGEARGATTLRIFDSGTLPRDSIWPAMDRFHDVAMQCIAAQCRAAWDVERQRFHERARKAVLHSGRMTGELAAVLMNKHKSASLIEGDDPLLDACRLVGDALTTPFIAPPERDRSEQGPAGAAEIARSSHVRARGVLLRGTWWRDDVGPFVAWRGDKRAPTAVISSSRGYVVVEPDTASRRRIDAEAARELRPEALMFYPPLPSSAASLKSLATFCLRNGAADIARILLYAFVISVIGLVPPLITQVLFDSVIPRTEWNQLTYCAIGLVMGAIGIASFRALQGVAILRLEGRLDSRLQTGIVDRLLQLPIAFFRRFTAADLTDRTLGIEAIRRVAVGHSVQGMLAGIFALFNFGLMFYFSVSLALIALALTSVRAIAIAASCALRLHHERQQFGINGKVQGLVLQLLTGIGKLRVADATYRGLGMWARGFADQKRHFIASQRIANLLGIFEAAFPILATLLIFVGAERQLNDLTFDSGQFLAFLLAFGQASDAVREVGAAIGAGLIALPRMDRLKPLITEPKEIEGQRNPPGKLSGEIELEQVTFRYVSSGPTILDKVTLQIRRGEYIAIVGPSGAGKSTIFRLLLGFEKPESGTILFDGKPIDTLDVAAVRRQLGVVLQNGKLTTGSIYENICGGTQLPLEDAWQAARLAGLDADIAAMPMGMHTMIAEGANTLSGGQYQRLMIARALVHKPRILLFDEATSALDNRTQSIVASSLAKLNVTRVVIAQRLSTVRNADRVIVLAGGKIVQSGTCAELLAVPGMFSEFVKRQLL
jgi:NHLM bacteriocin system ABC transporter ATP-binding protein